MRKLGDRFGGVIFDVQQVRRGVVKRSDLTTRDSLIGAIVGIVLFIEEMDQAELDAEKEQLTLPEVSPVIRNRQHTADCAFNDDNHIGPCKVTSNPRIGDSPSFVPCMNPTHARYSTDREQCPQCFAVTHSEEENAIGAKGGYAERDARIAKLSAANADQLVAITDLKEKLRVSEANRTANNECINRLVSEKLASDKLKDAAFLNAANRAREQATKDRVQATNDRETIIRLHNVNAERFIRIEELELRDRRLTHEYALLEQKMHKRDANLNACTGTLVHADDRTVCPVHDWNAVARTVKPECRYYDNTQLCDCAAPNRGEDGCKVHCTICLRKWRES